MENFTLAKIDLSLNEVEGLHKFREPTIIYYPTTGPETQLFLTKWTDLKKWLACNSPMYQVRFSSQCAYTGQEVIIDEL